MTFSGRVALVAGGGGGMGLNIANDLIAHGIHVCLADLKPALAGIRQGSGEHLYCQGDLSCASFVADIVADTVTRFGRLDYLVNTVGCCSSARTALCWTSNFPCGTGFSRSTSSPSC